MGYRSAPHTADIRIEAWAPTREECLAEAVAATVASFADTTGCEPATTIEVLVDPGTDEDLLLDLLTEVVYRLDADGLVPVTAEVEALEGGLRARLGMVGVDQVRQVGAPPKAVSLHDLAFTYDGSQWSCQVVLDV